MMRADASLHPDQARRQVGKSRLDLATRPFLPEYDRTTPIVPYDVKRVLADIDTNHGNCAARFLRHGMLLFGAPNQLRSLAGLEHGRTMPLAVLQRTPQPHDNSAAGAMRYRVRAPLSAPALR